MKNICRQIKLRKYRSELTEDICKETDGTEFIILYDDGKWSLDDTWDVRKALENDHIRGIHYIFDINDRITISRNVIIDTDAIGKGE